MAVLAGIVPTHAVVGERVFWAPTASASLSEATGCPSAVQISPLGCIVGRGATAMWRIPGISAERDLPAIAYLIDTFFAPRLVPTRGAKAAIEPLKIAPSAAACPPASPPMIKLLNLTHTTKTSRQLPL
jgi:hypothetical protein